MPIRRRAPLRLALLAALLATLPGCATTMSQMAYAVGGSADNMFPPRDVIYGGTRCHCGLLYLAATSERPSTGYSIVPAMLFVLVDMPLSFVADTVLLPVTLVEWVLLPPIDDEASTGRSPTAAAEVAADQREDRAHASASVHACGSDG